MNTETKYETTVNLLGDCLTQTSQQQYNEKVELLANHLLTEFDVPVFSEESIAVVKTHMEYNENLSPSITLLKNPNNLDDTIRDSVFPILVLRVLIRTNTPGISLTLKVVPVILEVMRRYSDIIIGRQFKLL